MFDDLRDLAVIRRRTAEPLTQYLLGRECDALKSAQPRTFEVEILPNAHRDYCTLVIRRRNRRVRARFESVFLHLPLETFSQYVLQPLMPAFDE